MGQVFFNNIPNLVKDSTTQVSIATTFMAQPTIIQIGGQSYRPLTTLTCQTTSTGAGYLDSGSIATTTLYYVYAIVSQTTFVPALVASTVAPSIGPTMPSGYGVAYKLVGAFYTNSSFQVGSVVPISGTAETELISFSPTAWGCFNGGTYSGRWRRIGDCMEITETVIDITSYSSGYVTPTIISGYGMDSTKLGIRAAVGTASSYGTKMSSGTVMYWGSGSTFYIIGENQTDVWKSDMPFTWAVNDDIHVRFSIPIVGWKATLL